MFILLIFTLSAQYLADEQTRPHILFIDIGHFIMYLIVIK